MPSYVYELTDPRDNPEPQPEQIVYIGITDSFITRSSAHRRGDGRPGEERAQWIVALRREGFVPAMRIRETHDTRTKAEEREDYWIRHYQAQGCIVLNDRKRGRSLDHLEPVPEDWISGEQLLEMIENDPFLQELWRKMQGMKFESGVILGGDSE